MFVPLKDFWDISTKCPSETVAVQQTKLDSDECGDEAFTDCNEFTELLSRAASEGGEWKSREW